MKTWLLLCLALPVLSCSNQSVSKSVPVPKAPPKTQSAIPKAIKVEESVYSALLKNQDVKNHALKQEEIVEDQKKTIDNAVAKVEEIKRKIIEKSVITEPEAHALLEEINKIREQNNLLKLKIVDLKKDVKFQEELLWATRNTVKELNGEISAKESEADELRRQNDFLGEQVRARNKDVNALQGQLSKAEKKAAANGTWRNIGIGVAVFLGLGIIVYVLIRTYLPTVKF